MCDKIYIADRVWLRVSEVHESLNTDIIGRYLNKDAAIKRCNELNDGNSFLSVHGYPLGDCKCEFDDACLDVIHKPTSGELIKQMEAVERAGRYRFKGEGIYYEVSDDDIREYVSNKSL